MPLQRHTSWFGCNQKTKWNNLYTINQIVGICECSQWIFTNIFNKYDWNFNVKTCTQFMKSRSNCHDFKLFLCHWFIRIHSLPRTKFHFYMRIENQPINLFKLKWILWPFLNLNLLTHPIIPFDIYWANTMKRLRKHTAN